MTRDKLKKELGKRIVELREQKGWSQSDLARACNKDRQAIEKLENGKVNPTLYTLLEVANALEISLENSILSPKPLKTDTFEPVPACFKVNESGVE